jgi:hypothetical protein
MRTGCLSQRSRNATVGPHGRLAFTISPALGSAHRSVPWRLNTRLLKSIANGLRNSGNPMTSLGKLRKFECVLEGT